MTIRGCVSVIQVETAKLLAQLKVRLVLVTCVVSPLAFAVAMRVQSSVPSDTLFGRAITDSGFAVPLVVLAFAVLWFLPVLASIVGGDLFSAEDRYGTWTTVLTRSRSRAELFAGKTLTAVAFSAIAVTALAVSSVAAGIFVIGRQPLVALSGVLLPAPEAMTRVAFAWLSIVPPTLALTALAVLVSIVTRSSAAGIGLPVVALLIMQLCAFVDGPETIRRLLITSAFDAWHGFLSEPPYFGPFIYGTTVSGAYFVASIGVAYRLMRRRDIGR